MLILSLFRHAKSAWGDASSGDFERPLAARGEAAAPLMGRWMADHGLIPDIVLSSPSARTRATCALAFGSLGAPPVIRFEDAQLSPMQRSFYSECKRLRVDRLHEELGVTLAYPTFREGLAAIHAGEQPFVQP